MTESNYLIIKNKEGIYRHLYYGTCQTSSMMVDEYHFVLKYEIEDNILNLFIDGIKEEICKDISIVDDLTEKNVPNLIRYDGLNKAIKINNKGLPIKHKLLINQIVRYLGTQDSLPVVLTYAKLKEMFPEIDFWKLFYISHLISPPRRYNSYHQPFASCGVHINYDFNIVKKLLKNKYLILDSTSCYMNIPNHIINSIKNSYISKNIIVLRNELINLFTAKEKKFICINSANTLHLTKNEIYTGVYTNQGLVKVINNDFQIKNYSYNRFKETK